jgi:hypothetical protein
MIFKFILFFVFFIHSSSQNEEIYIKSKEISIKEFVFHPKSSILIALGDDSTVFFYDY